MFITKKNLSRRTVLRGLGVSVALPLLDAMVPAGTALARTAAAAKPRLAFVYFPHGAVMDQWTPKATGADFELSPILAPLAPFRKHLTVVSGLENDAPSAAPVHTTTPGTWLSYVPARDAPGAYAGMTVDQIAAQCIGRDSRLRSLEVATEEQGGEGVSGWGSECSLRRTISFQGPSQPLPMEQDPGRLLRRLFGERRPAAESVAVGNASIVDLVRSDAADLSRTLGARDRVLLADYLGSVRQIEQRVQRLSGSGATGLERPAAPDGAPGAFDERMRLMFDLVALAFQVNLTRVTTLMMAAEVSRQPYGFIGVPDAFHALSHHQNDPAKMARLAQVQRFNTAVFAEFVRRLAELADGEGSMLDHSIILFGSNMSDSNRHDHFPLPTAIIGRGAGRIKGNRHLRLADRTPLARLHAELLARAGLPLARLGERSAAITEI